MSKVIKLKQSDVNKIVKNIIEQQQGYAEFDEGKLVSMGNNNLSKYENPNGEPLQVGMDENGNYVILRNVNGVPVIIAEVKGKSSEIRQAAE